VSADLEQRLADVERQVAALSARLATTSAGPAPTLAEIITACCQAAGISVAAFLSAGRCQEFMLVRCAAALLARELTTASLPKVGRAFGGRDHTTVMNQLRRAEERRHDPEFVALLAAARAQLNLNPEGSQA